MFWKQFDIWTDRLSYVTLIFVSLYLQVSVLVGHSVAGLRPFAQLLVGFLSLHVGSLIRRTLLRG